MNEPLENLYFNWLCSKVVYLENSTPSLTHWNVLGQLQRTEYVWLISGDDNRAEDGVNLRDEFLLESGLDDEGQWDHLPCSVLEMLIAFSRRLELATDVPGVEWFWEMMENLKLKILSDSMSYYESYVDELLQVFVWRRYEPDGKKGGMFPIDDPKRDQTKLELWYQFCDYLADQDRMP